MIEIDGTMKDINDFSYTITNWDGSVTETNNIKEARVAVREGRHVSKLSRRVFQSGPAFVRLYVTVDIQRVEDL